MSYITAAEYTGRKRGIAEMLLFLLNEKFYAVPDSYNAKIQEADIETLLRWAEKLLDAKTLDEVFCE